MPPPCCAVSPQVHKQPSCWNRERTKPTQNNYFLLTFEHQVFDDILIEKLPNRSPSSTRSSGSPALLTPAGPAVSSLCPSENFPVPTSPYPAQGSTIVDTWRDATCLQAFLTSKADKDSCHIMLWPLPYLYDFPTKQRVPPEQGKVDTSPWTEGFTFTANIGQALIRCSTIVIEYVWHVLSTRSILNDKR